jgi:AcrR family transcriptional regulator
VNEERTRRRYDSPVRRQRAAETRECIVVAGAELARSFTTWDWNDLTFAAVAQRAGVGERTVYRYFPTERQLHDGVMQRLEDEAGVSYDSMSLDEVAEVASRVYSALGSFSVADVGVPDDPSFVAEDDRRRRALLDAVGRTAAHWPAARRERAAAAVDVLWSMSTYERLIGAWRLDSRDATDIIGWLVRLVVEAIERDDGPPATRRRAPTLQAAKPPNRSV